MREKLLAQEAKQHDPKVQPETYNMSLCLSRHKAANVCVLQVQAQKKRQQQHELIAELRRRQAKDHRPVYEGKDGTIEDIITGGPDSSLRKAHAGGAGGAGRPRPRMTVVIHCSAPLKCTLCYVVQTPAHVEHGSSI